MVESETVLQNRYRIVRKIGQGGMGAVYEAVDQRFNSTVALKQCLVDDPRLGKAFEREAHTLNALRHAALPVVIDYFAEGEDRFLVMQFIPGDDLGTILEKRKQRVQPIGVAKPFEVEEVLEWTDQLLDALDYLHTQQPPVIHRDIKPQNLKLSGRGQIVLLDFGLAKGAPYQTSHTESSASIFGYTPVYAPLEQMKGKGTDPRSDLYSLAATVYHLLTGTPPPDAVTRVSDVTDDQIDPIVPVDKVNSLIPSPVSDLLVQAMSLRREMRPQSAAEMRRMLRAARGMAISVPLPSEPSELPTVLTQANDSPSTVIRQSATVQASSLPFSQSTPSEASALSPTRPPLENISGPPRKSSKKVIVISAIAIVLLLVAIAGWWVFNNISSVETPDPALASKERESPTSLGSREIIGHGRADDVYYSFEAGPGEMALNLNVIAGGGGVEIELYDPQSRKMRFADSSEALKVWSSYNHNEQASARVLIERRQQVLMRIAFTYPDVVTAYRVRIGGEVSLRKAGKRNELLAAPFSSRDDPTVLPAKEIVGRSKADDIYYVFDAEAGEINLALDVIASGGSVSIEIFDDEGTRFRFSDGSTEFKVWSSYNHDERSRMKLFVDRKQTVLMRVSQDYSNSIQAYRARIEGPVSAGGVSLADKSGDAITSDFLLRDNPLTLQADEIAGRGKPEDIYYSFEAGPGDLEIALKVIASGGAVSVNLFGEDLKELRYEDKNEFTVWSNSNEEEEGSAKVELEQKQRILMRVSFTYSNSVGDYKLKIDGASMASQ